MRLISSLKAMAVVLGTALPMQHPALAQDTAADGADEAAEAALFSPEELDTLLAPVALYPDPLLAQVMMASTYPVDVLKADRFLLKNAGLDDKARSALVAEQDWADPVKELAAGFPELVSRMAEHVDWTEQTGNAVIAQTDDVLASLQRLRAQAKLNGYLEDNEAMTVEEDPESGSITISSANPEVVYVPQYTETVYTQPAPATPIYVTDENDWDDYLATGAIIWGSAVIIDEIFDDDDWDDGWNHWYGGNGGGNSIDWDGDINIDNGINIGNGNGNDIGGGIDIGNGIGNGGIGNGNGGLGNLERPTTLPATLPGRLGDVDSDRLSNRKDGSFKPSDASRDAAREKIAKAKVNRGTGGGVATLPAVTGKADLGKVSKGPKPSVKLPQVSKPSNKAAKPAKTIPKSIAKPKKPAAAKGNINVSKKKAAPVYLPSSGNRAGAASLRGNKSLKRNR